MISRFLYQTPKRLTKNQYKEEEEGMSTVLQPPGATVTVAKKPRGRPPKVQSVQHHHSLIGAAIAASSIVAITPASTSSTSTSSSSVDPEQAATKHTPAPVSRSTRRKSACDILLESNVPVPVSVDLQEAAIALVGREVTERAVSVSNNDTAHFCAIMNSFERFMEKKPGSCIPPLWYKDPHWDMSAQERVQMLDEAFAVQDDDAELRTVPDGEFTCRACKSRRIHMKLRQIRSGDEAMTQFFTCADCKKKWIVH
jgi:DNA-directed RNA polymerase subunit M/transcription elongation factor TFIIS